MKFRPRPNTQLVRTTTKDGEAASTARSPSSLLRPYSESGATSASSARGRLARPSKT
jgi:hypothetical protein